MPSYWIVVRRGNPELYEALCVAFRGQTGFSVLLDRRKADDGRHRAAGDRREAPVAWGDDEFIVAERIEAGCAVA